MNHYLKVTLRNFFKHNVSSLINLVGLTTGLTCAFFIYLCVQDEFKIIKFHEKDDRLFRVMEFQTYSKPFTWEVYTYAIFKGCERKVNF